MDRKQKPRTFKLMSKTLLMSEDFPTPVWTTIEHEYEKTNDSDPSDDEDPKPIKFATLRSGSDKEDDAYRGHTARVSSTFDGRSVAIAFMVALKGSRVVCR